jgi:hypothetical protein
MASPTATAASTSSFTTSGSHTASAGSYAERAGGVAACDAQQPPLHPAELLPLDAAMNRRLFAVVARYESLSGTASGIQGAVPHHVFAALEARLGVRQEAYASPLNCHFPAFCSLFPDTDRFLGSHGSFYEFTPRCGAFEANPPFVNKVMVRCVQHILDLLADSERVVAQGSAGAASSAGAAGSVGSAWQCSASAPGAVASTGAPGDVSAETSTSMSTAAPCGCACAADNSSSSRRSTRPSVCSRAHARTPGCGCDRPLLFVVFAPAWRDAYYHRLALSSPFLRWHAELGRKDHDYIDGMQHRAGRMAWGANVDSCVYVLANAAGAAAWPCSDAVKAQLLADMRRPIADAGGAGTPAVSPKATTAASGGRVSGDDFISIDTNVGAAVASSSYEPAAEGASSPRAGSPA